MDLEKEINSILMDLYLHSFEMPYMIVSQLKDASENLDEVDSFEPTYIINSSEILIKSAKILKLTNKLLKTLKNCDIQCKPTS